MNLSPVSENAQAIASGKHNVQDDCVVRRGAGSDKTFVAVVAHIDSIAFSLQGFADERGGLLLVFNDQHAHASNDQLPPFFGDGLSPESLSARSSEYYLIQVLPLEGNESIGADFPFRSFPARGSLWSQQ